MDVLGQRLQLGDVAGVMRKTLEACLIQAARAGQTLTYAELAARLELRPPHTIHRTALLLEDLMRDQAAKGEPQLASIVVSKARAGLPAPGFFILMRELDLYNGPDTGQPARTFVEEERLRCQQAWRASGQ